MKKILWGNSKLEIFLVLVLHINNVFCGFSLMKNIICKYVLKLLTNYHNGNFITILSNFDLCSAPKRFRHHFGADQLSNFI